MTNPTDPTPKKRGDDLYDPRSIKAWRLRFLDGLRKHGVVTIAAKEAGIHRDTAYFERQQDATFAQEWEEALERGVDALEDAAKLRAFEGSDVLLMFLLKSHRPKRYRETTRVEIDIDWNTVPDDLNDAFADGAITLDELYRQLRKRTRSPV